jgi:hypothetical protein
LPKRAADRCPSSHNFRINESPVTCTGSKPSPGDTEPRPSLKCSRHTSAANCGSSIRSGRSSSSASSYALGELFHDLLVSPLSQHWVGFQKLVPALLLLLLGGLRRLLLLGLRLLHQMLLDRVDLLLERIGVLHEVLVRRVDVLGLVAVIRFHRSS